VLLPDRAAVEGLEPPLACSHVAETAKPHEAVWIIEIPELAQQLHADRFLRLDELAVEKRDQCLARAWTERIAA
jgi:hypothetical protein